VAQRKCFFCDGSDPGGPNVGMNPDHVGGAGVPLDTVTASGPPGHSIATPSPFQKTRSAMMRTPYSRAFRALWIGSQGRRQQVGRVASLQTLDLESRFGREPSATSA